MVSIAKLSPGAAFLGWMQNVINFTVMNHQRCNTTCPQLIQHIQTCYRPKILCHWSVNVLRNQHSSSNWKPWWKTIIIFQHSIKQQQQRLMECWKFLNPKAQDAIRSRTSPVTKLRYTTRETSFVNQQGFSNGLIRNRRQSSKPARLQIGTTSSLKQSLPEWL